MSVRNLSVLSTFALSALLVGHVACGSSSSGSGSGDDGGASSSGSGSGGSSGGTSSSGSSGGSSGGSSSSGGSTSSSGGSSGGSSSSSGGSSSSSGGTSSSSSGSSSGGFPSGTICNDSGTARTPPSAIKNLIVILFENENYSSVNGDTTNAPYFNSLASACGVATAYNDNCFTDNLVSLPHYLALTSGSNCNSGLDHTGSGCITDDNDATSHTLTTTSIFSQVTSWKSYQEDMPSACDQSSSSPYAAKHNPAAYYTSLSSCSTNDVAITGVTCDASTPMTACTPAPSNGFTQDLANDTLAALTFITPNLDNDMHDGTVTQADNWLYTYMPLILQSKAYLRGDVVVQLLWDEQNTSTFGGSTPNAFISPYITKGTQSSTPFNHFAVLRSWESAQGIATFLGCASGTQTGGSGSCPAGSTADVRAALGW